MWKISHCLALPVSITSSASLTSDDIMLNYQTNAYHDAQAVREVLGLRPIREFEIWL